ncbi:MAG: RAD55 family ATPase [Thaumarchaeota archaeon]|nr:RAD55 family ATPase [Nitrososphaerota archaeon]
MIGISQTLSELLYKEAMPNGLTLLSGATGSGKTIFAAQYAQEMLLSGGKVLWITTEELPTTLKARMSRFGWSFEKSESERRLQIIDAVSPARLGFSENMGRGVLGLDPTGMLILITDQLRKNESSGSRFLVVVDSISRLLLSCDSKSVIDFVSCLSSRLENYGTQGMVTVAEGAHDDRILNSLIFSCGSTFRFKMKEEDQVRARQFRIETLRERKHDDRWKNYKITDSGLDIEI